MKKKILSILLTLTMLVALVAALGVTASATEWASSGTYAKPETVTGTGASDDPYIISTGADLNALAAAVNGVNQFQTVNISS